MKFAAQVTRNKAAGCSVPYTSRVFVSGIVTPANIISKRGQCHGAASGARAFSPKKKTAARTLERSAAAVKDMPKNYTFIIAYP